MNNGKLQLWSKAALKITHPWVNVIIFLSNWQRTEKIHNWCSWCRQLSKGPKSTEEQFKSAIDTEKNQRGHCWGIQKIKIHHFYYIFQEYIQTKQKKLRYIILIHSQIIITLTVCRLVGRCQLWYIETDMLLTDGKNVLWIRPNDQCCKTSLWQNVSKPVLKIDSLF